LIGNKKNDVKVVYTPFTNLKKEASHEAGQVAFHSTKLLKFITVEKRINAIVNRLNHTKSEDTKMDWAADKERRLREEKGRRRAQFEASRQQREVEEREKEASKQARSYDNVFKQEKMTSNKFDGPVDVKKYEEEFF
jgi:coiled-coil domain-containing protein 25